MILIISENSLWKVKNMTKQTKIIISLVLSCTFLLLLFIPSFASESVVPLAEGDTILIEAGSYRFNDTITLDASLEADIPFTLKPFTVRGTENGETFEATITFNGTKIDNYSSYLQFVGSYRLGGSEISNVFIAYSEGQWVEALDLQSAGVTLVSGDPNSWGKVIVITEDTYVPLDFGLWFNNSTELLPDYEGNPFTDFMNLVVEALDIPLFGSFSLWDMLTTICGLFAVIWLLKLLAGG